MCNSGCHKKNKKKTGVAPICSYVQETLNNYHVRIASATNSKYGNKHNKLPLYMLTNLMRLLLLSTDNGVSRQDFQLHGPEYLEMLCFEQPVAAAQTKPRADSCGLQMSKQVLPSNKKKKLITFATRELTSGQWYGPQKRKKEGQLGKMA